jgi:Protein of unknown function (DUF3631)
MYEGRKGMSKRGDPDYVLNAVRGFISALYWGPEEYTDAMPLVLATGHVMDAFPAVPYVLVTSKDPGVGKSTLSRDIPQLLAYEPWRVSRNTTTDALRNKFLERTRPRSILLDDASKVFNVSGTGGRTTPLYQLGVDGYTRNATVSVSRNGSTMDLPAYVMFYMNGLGNGVPDDLASRAIRFRLTAMPDGVQMRDALSDGVRREAEPLKAELHRWATGQAKALEQFMQSQAYRVHPRMTGRLRQLWAPLFAVAAAAGGDWPRRCLNAFEVMALDEGGSRPVLQRGEQALLDAAAITMKTGVQVLFAGDLVRGLRALPSDFYRAVDDDYLVRDLLPGALGPLERQRGLNADGKAVTGMGWRAAPVLRAARALIGELDAVQGTGQAGTDAVQAALEMTEA